MNRSDLKHSKTPSFNVFIGVNHVLTRLFHENDQGRKCFSVPGHQKGTYILFLNLKTCSACRSRAVDIPRYQVFCSTPNSHGEIVRGKKNFFSSKSHA